MFSFQTVIRSSIPRAPRSAGVLLAGNSVILRFGAGYSDQLDTRFLEPIIRAKEFH